MHFPEFCVQVRQSWSHLWQFDPCTTYPGPQSQHFASVLFRYLLEGQFVQMPDLPEQAWQLGPQERQMPSSVNFPGELHMLSMHVPFSR